MLAGCLEEDKQARVRHKALYVRLGGREGITRIVEDFAAHAAENKNVPSEQKDLLRDGKRKEKIVERICAALRDEPKADRRGRAERTEAATGRARETDPLTASFVEALKKNQVDEKDRKELLDELGSIRDLLLEPSKGDTTN
jgi:hypothetical protein